MSFGLKDSTIRRVNSILASFPEIEEAILYGSRAKGNYKTVSDIDLTLVGKEIDLRMLNKVSLELDNLSTPYKFDLSIYQYIENKDLVDHINRVGIIFYKKNESEWKGTSLREVSTDISYGYTASANDEPVGPKFLRITDIAQDRINWDTVPYCEIDTAIKSKYELDVGDIVVARTGATTGYNAIIKEKSDVVFASYLIRYRIDQRIANPFYIGYLLKSQRWKGFVENAIGGSAQPGANAQQFADFEFDLPSMSEQNEIVEVLSSLDDKIDLLHRQNNILEALAETLFRQWFIEEAEEQSDKQILLGTLIDSVSITHNFPSAEIVFLNTSDIYRGEVLTNEPVNVKSLPGQAKKSVKRNDILYSEIRPANGRYAFIDFDVDNYVVSTKLMVLRSKDLLSQAFVYFYLTHPKTSEWLQILAEARSGTFPQITFDQLRDLRINIPSDSKLSQGIQWSESALGKIKSNAIQIRSLTQLRDTLLPKLMSGEIRIGN